MNEEEKLTILLRIAEAIDDKLYLPMKAELRTACIVHSLGFRKESLKREIETILDEFTT